MERSIEQRHADERVQNMYLSPSHLSFNGAAQFPPRNIALNTEKRAYHNAGDPPVSQSLDV